MKELVKSNETENKPKNVKKAIKAGWKTAEEIYSTTISNRRTWDNFIADIRNAISQKSNSSYAIDCITKNCITGPHNTKYYHPKVEEAFQAWLMKNQSNQGRASATIKEATTQAVEKDWYSKQELAIEFGVDPKTIQRIVNEQITLDRPVQTKKGGGQRTEGSIIKQEIHDTVDNSGYKYSKENILVYVV